MRRLDPANVVWPGLLAQSRGAPCEQDNSGLDALPRRQQAYPYQYSCLMVYKQRKKTFAWEAMEGVAIYSHSYMGGVFFGVANVTDR